MVCPLLCLCLSPIVYLFYLIYLWVVLCFVCVYPLLFIYSIQYIYGLSSALYLSILYCLSILSNISMGCPLLCLCRSSIVYLFYPIYLWFVPCFVCVDPLLFIYSIQYIYGLSSALFVSILYCLSILSNISMGCPLLCMCL